MLCSICSAEVNLGDGLCQECGFTLGRVEDKVKANEQAIEIRPGAALCASIEGYIRLCEILPLAEVGAIVNEYLERLLPQLQSDGAGINWYTGEKIVAYFGLSALEDAYTPSARAVQAALNLHRVFAQFSSELLESYARDVELELRVGVASGDLLRGTLGDAALERPAWSRRVDFEETSGRRPRYRRLVIGDVVNLAVQLEYQARPGHILTDAATCLQAQQFEFSPLGECILRRRSLPVAVFNVVGPRPAD